MAYAVAFSPDGQRLAAPGKNGEAIIRDTATGRVIFRLPGHEEVAKCVSFSPTFSTGGAIIRKAL